MLATQTADGDLRVWSVSKPPTSEPPRVIRVLKRPDPTFLPGRTWLSWSKNGRILQYSETETWSWDVRTKHVTYETVPVLEGIRGLAAYGPSATLFSLGPDFTVQQYDLDQSRIVANIRHAPYTVPPTPPEQIKQLDWTTSESEEDLYSPVTQSRKPPTDRQRMMSPQSQLSGTTSIQSRPSKYSSRQRDITSPARQSELTGTTFSAGTQATYLHDHLKSPGSSRVRRKSSKLREQVPISPQDRPVDDLFPFTRARLNDVPYKPPKQLSESEITPNSLRRQMLLTVFGWSEDIQDLIRDEMSRHAPDSQHAILLSRWLAEDDEYLCEIMGNTSVMSTMDWMLLTLGTIDHSASTKRTSQVFIEKMLSRGDVHVAATMLLALGDLSDAIEVYVSRNQFLEAVLLTCLVTPADWQRQSYLVRKWGEHVVENSQQQLAIRCFSCSGGEPSEPWTSPTAPTTSSMNYIAPYVPDQSTSEEEISHSHHESHRQALMNRRVLDAPTPVAMPAPPTPFRTAHAQHSRVTPQNSALKLITNFAPPQKIEYKFPGLKSADYTPTATNSVTPIAESAIDRSALSAASPGGSGSYRQNNIRSLNAAMSARGNNALHRQRLPSIGETPVDVEGPSFKTSPPPPLPRDQLPTPADSSSEKEREEKRSRASEEDVSEGSAPQEEKPVTSNTDLSTLTLTPARYQPTHTSSSRETPQTAVRPRPDVEFPHNLPRPNSRSSDLEDLASLDQQQPRTGSRSRKPDGLSINLAPTKSEYVEIDHHSGTQPRTGQTYSTTQFDTNSEMTSPLRTGDTIESRTKSPSVSHRSICQYISSIEQAHYYNHNARSRETSSSKMKEKRDRTLTRRESDTSEQRTINPAKRSPSSPIPMSPEYLRMYTQSVESIDSSYPPSADRSGTPASRSRLGQHHARARRDDTRRHRSQSAKGSSSKQKDGSLERRSRSRSRQERGAPRSPSSPLPMVPSEEDRTRITDPSMRFVSADRQHRSREASRQREQSVEPRPVHRSRSRTVEDVDGHVSRRSSVSNRSGRRHRKREGSAPASERRHVRNGLGYDSLTGESSSAIPLETEIRSGSTNTNMRRKDLAKELAAAELEARRLSLARRPSAPVIPFPGQAAHGKSASESNAPPPLYRANTHDPSTTRHHGDSRIRRPATPRAMQVPSEAVNGPVESSGNLEMLLPSSVYQSPNPDAAHSPRPHTSHFGRGHVRTRSHGMDDPRTHAEMEAALAQLPRHPAYSTQVARSRETSRTRGISRDRAHQSSTVEDIGPMIIDSGAACSSPPPMLLPELQHLATPPPPPPPPAPPKDKPQLSLRTVDPIATRTPLPSSANPRTDDGANNGSMSAGPSLQGGHHRRGRSGNLNLGGGGDSSQFMGKIKSFAGKMRTSSQNRDNSAKSPPQQWTSANGVSGEGHNGEGISPYETNTGFAGGQGVQT